MTDYFGVDEPALLLDYLKIRYTLDKEYSDATIIVSLLGDIYVTFNDREFKL